MKRTLDNCRLIKYFGKPQQQEEKCYGFGKSYMDDEPCDTCKKCKLHIHYDE